MLTRVAIFVVFVAMASAQSFTVCKDYSGLFTLNSWTMGDPIAVGQFFSVNLIGYINDTIVDGDLQLRLYNSDSGILAEEVRGLNICNLGQNGHNLCGLPAGAAIVQPSLYWSSYYPSGNYSLSMISFSSTATSQHEPTLCGNFDFMF